MSAGGHQAAPTRRARLVHELGLYAGIACYLWICIGAVFLYRAALLEEHGLTLWHWGLAAAKALVLGKFILLLHAARLGERGQARPLAQAVLVKSLLFLVALLLLSVLEEAALGAIHHRSLAETAAGLLGPRGPEILASSLILWLVLIPYLAFRGLGEALGEDALRRLLFGPR